MTLSFTSVVRILALAIAMGWVGCASLPQSTTDARFQKKYGHFTYCEVKAVIQTTAASCGAACLACVGAYWEKEWTEASVMASRPAASPAGYSLSELQAISASQGLAAYGIAMNQRPEGATAALSGHLKAGRPVIIAVECPVGRYFGAPLPLIETLDRRSFHPLHLGKVSKKHYVVVCGESSEAWLVMDPCYGLGSVAKQSLLDWWRAGEWAALIASPVTDAASPTPSE
jgi:predicted double-glycine peptidase